MSRNGSSALITTERLVIRRLLPGDVDELFAVYGDPESMRWVGDGQPLDRAACEQWVGVTERNVTTRGYGMSVMVDRASGEVVGFVGLVHPGGQELPELKYALKRDQWGKGLATEAARAMLAWGADRFGLTTIIATIAPENDASRRILEKLGMTEVEPRLDDDGLPTLVFRWVAPG
ncbi:MAG TPA: GNAT family N-acetyltransferase [Candidatus Eisenbacteria bacterium]